MNTIKVFGRTIPLAVLAVVLLALVATAALVNYLSNKVEADVTVRSPMALRVGTEGNLGTGTYLLDLIEGGETVSFFMEAENLGNVPVTGTLENLITNVDGITCDDFTDIKAKVKTNSGVYSDWFVFDLTGISGAMPNYSIGDGYKCYEVDANTIQLAFTPSNPWTWPASPYVDTIEISATFNPAASGSYVFTSQVKV